MSDSVDLLVVTALRSELEGALPALGPSRPLEIPKPGRLARYRLGERTIAAGWTGMGREATDQFFQALPIRPSRVLHLGVAGGLVPELVAGDAILCTRADRSDGPEQLVLDPPQALVALVGAPRVGGCVTVPAVASTPAAKRALAERFPAALVVEMETLWAAQHAERLGAPLACVRVVCDALDDQLPDLSPALDASGRPRPLAMLKHLAKRPRAVGKLPRLASAFGKAQRTLTAVIERVARG